jgi:predicted glycoside hydrolase/deacetylase ChbG (UPF0249 family)
LLCCASQVFAQSNWAERLGFPSGKRVVILHANDMGITYECNRPVQQGLTDDVLTSASCITAGPWFTECAEWAKDKPDLDLGISLSFVSPSPVLKWTSVAARKATASLTDVDGYLPQTVLQFHLRAELKEVRCEAEAQIQRARSLGVQPTHIHPHLGAMLTRPDLLRLYLQLAEEYWIPAVMVELSPDLVARFREEGFPMSDEMLQTMANYALPKVDDIKNLAPATSYDHKRQQFYCLVEELKPGITQIFLTPSDDSPGMRRASSKAQDRVWEAQLLTDPEVLDFLKKQDLVYTNWRDIMQRFESIHAIRDSVDQ